MYELRRILKLIISMKLWTMTDDSNDYQDDPYDSGDSEEWVNQESSDENTESA